MELLGQNFDTAFAAPDGIPRLRELILKLAMQGKLVPQDPNDAPVSELLRSIEVEKKRLVKERKIKAPKTLPEITASDEPYSLPHGWQWVRLGAIGNIFNGNSINASEKESKYAGVEGLPYIATKDVGYGFDQLDYDNGICIPLDEEKFRIAHQGAVLICAEGGSAGKKCGLTDRDICFGNKLFANELYGQIPSRFILYVYLSSAFRASFTAAMTGIIGGVSIAKFVEIPIPLPPLEEQRRIVNKIGELMTRCDEIEKLLAEKQKKRLMIHSAAIQQLLNVAQTEDGQRAQVFLAEHFYELYTVKENVAELRKAILQLAMMGRLVKQSPDSRPVRELQKEIEAEKKRQVEEGMIKHPKPIPPIKPEEVPYELPVGWEWVRLGELAEFVNGDRGKNYPNREEYVAEGIPWINTGHIEPDGSLTRSGMYFITKEKFEILNGGKIQPGDLVYCLRGATFGKTAIVDPYAEGAIASSLMIIRPYAPIFNRYIYKYLISPVGRSQIFRFDNGSAQPNLSANSVRLYVCPLPPVADQHRIVARVDQLMVICDTLEQQISASNKKQTELLDAVIAQI